ncbi:MAG: radical SAM protein, partial [Coriobacteriales bacterium]
PPVVYKRVVRDFDAMPFEVAQIVPYAEATFDRFAVEVLRGCSRGCRFCQAGMVYRPVRERSADTVVSTTMRGLACTGYDEVSLTSLSTTDHSQIESILRRLNARLAGTGVRVSIPSQRVDAFGVGVAQLVAGAKKGGLTFAPEAGTQRLRDCINKNITEDDLFAAVAAAMEAGWRRMKLYFMCGLPTETDEDLRGIGDLVGRALDVARGCVPDKGRPSVRASVSCALFVPKPDTPFQWCAQIGAEELERRVGVIRASLPRKGVDFHWHEPATSFIEAAVSRGGREFGAVIAGAWRHGARFDAWREHFDYDAWKAGAAEAGVDLEREATRERPLSEPLPWAHISCGVSPRYLASELERARRGQTTPDCTFETCTGCGVCPALGCSVRLGGERHG